MPIYMRAAILIAPACKKHTAPNEKKNQTIQIFIVISHIKVLRITHRTKWEKKKSNNSDIYCDFSHNSAKYIY